MEARRIRLAPGIVVVSAALFVLFEWRALTFPTVLAALAGGLRTYYPVTLWGLDLAVLVGGPVAHLALLRRRSVLPVLLAVAYRAAAVVLLAILSRGLFAPMTLSEISSVFWLLLAVEGALLAASIALLRLRWREAVESS